jgi:phosphoribosylformimino-5-aminoimidazole carboxamide ribotide isomerase
VVVGTAALEAAFLRRASTRLGPRLAVAIDVRGGRVASHGWGKTAPLAAEQLARTCAGAGVARLLVTSTARDGSLAGPELALLESVLAASRLPVVAAGGIASLDDLRRVRALGCEGAIAGSALWTGRFSVAEANLLCEEPAGSAAARS